MGQAAGRETETRDVQLQEKDAEIERLQREVQALRVNTCRISRLKSDCPINIMIFSYVHWQVEMDTQLQHKDVQLQQKDGQIQRQGTELRERTLQLNRQLREVQTLRVRKRENEYSTV